MIPDDALEAIDWLRVEPATDDRRGTCGDAVLMLARAEIERLRSACKFDPYGRPVHVCEKLFNVTAERDQLRAEVDQQRLELGITEDACGMLESEVKQLRARVAELDAALANVLDGYGGWVKAQNAALAEQIVVKNSAHALATAVIDARKVVGASDMKPPAPSEEA